jgi:hypothetical protein
MDRMISYRAVGRTERTTKRKKIDDDTNWCSIIDLFAKRRNFVVVFFVEWFRYLHLSVIRNYLLEERKLCNVKYKQLDVTASKNQFYCLFFIFFSVKKEKNISSSRGILYFRFWFDSSWNWGTWERETFPLIFDTTTRSRIICRISLWNFPI